MVIVSVTNIKGGVGKTLTTINLGGELARLGKKVLILDNDPQSNISQILDIKNPEITLYDVYTNKNIGFNECIYQVEENLYVVPNRIESAKLEMDLSSRMNRECILKSKLDTLPKIFDFVLIDNSPFLGILTQNSLTISRYFLAVVDNSSSSLQGLNMLNQVVAEIKENGLNEKISLIGILRSRFDKNTRFTKDFNQVLESKFSAEIFETTIYNTVKYKEAAAMKMIIQKYDKKASEPYEKLALEVMDRVY